MIRKGLDIDKIMMHFLIISTLGTTAKGNTIKKQKTAFHLGCCFCERIKDGIIELNDVPNREEAETCSPIKKTRVCALVFWLLMGDVLSFGIMDWESLF